MKKINKKKIKYYAGMGGWITTVLVVSPTIAFLTIKTVDKMTDHTQEICYKCIMDNRLVEGRNDGLTKGIEHQMNEMKKTYENHGINAMVEYVPIDYDKIPAERKIDDNGTIYYEVPYGYSLKMIDGIAYLVKNSVEEGVIVTHIYDSEKTLALGKK